MGIQHFNDYGLKGYEDLELSTQILIDEALKRNIRVEVLDRVHHVVEFSKGSLTEIVVQATKTSKDTYVAVETMTYKAVTKLLLNRQGIRVPGGDVYDSQDEALAVYDRWKSRGIVIKPNSTNFGIGITKLEENFTQEAYVQSLQEAFLHDRQVLIEEFIAGKEYRFLVVNGQLQGVIHRHPAYVTGDGVASIEDLVAQKNKHPWRGRGHVSPLEYIELGSIEQATLQQQGLAVDTILPQGQIGYLRHNSNISTGGEPFDYTQQAHSFYGDIACQVARNLDVAICGVDIITPDITVPCSSYCVLEANFNPVLYFHYYPTQGTPRRVGQSILDLLGFID